MKARMTHRARAELADSIRPRYRAANSQLKHKILEEFVAATGYHEKSAIRVLNGEPTTKQRQTRGRASLYDEAARAALIVLWEASDRVCSKRLRALLPILVPALERNKHLKLDDAIRSKLLAMSAATIDRLLRAPRNVSRPQKPRRAVPEPRRRVPLRTYADWQDPAPGSMEMDLVAHCGDVNRGSYINSLVMTDIASGWTEAAPLVVREGSLVVETIERIRASLPFNLCALDVDNGSEFVNEKLIEYCLSRGIELTRSRPYRKNDQAWIEQKNGAVVRKLLGYRRFEGLAAAKVITRLYGASRLFVNFFQPSFKLASKSRQGAQVSKRYHPPQTPSDRLLQAENIPEATKARLREVAAALDPLQLLEEIRAMQAHLMALANGETKPCPQPQPPDLAAFVAGLSSAWRFGEPRPTFSIEAKPRYLRSVQSPPPSRAPTVAPSPRTNTASEPPPVRVEQVSPRPEIIYAARGTAKIQAMRMVWPLVCRRLEDFPNINCTQLFEELCAQFPGRFTRGQYRRLLERVKAWRQDARARGVTIHQLKHRRLTNKPRGNYRDIFKAHWREMVQCLEAQPDQTALELLVEFKARYPERYSMRNLSALQRRVKVWRQQAIQRLIAEVNDASRNVLIGAGLPSADAATPHAGNILNEAMGNKIT